MYLQLSFFHVTFEDAPGFDVFPVWQWVDAEG